MGRLGTCLGKGMEMKKEGNIENREEKWTNLNASNLDRI